MDLNNKTYYSYNEVEALIVQANERLYKKEAWLNDCCVDMIRTLEGESIYHQRVKCGICDRLITFVHNRAIIVDPTGVMYYDETVEEK